MDQQNPKTTLNQPSYEQMEKSNLTGIIIAIVATFLITGGTVFAWQTSVIKSNNVKNQESINQLRNQILSLQTLYNEINSNKEDDVITEAGNEDNIIENSKNIPSDWKSYINEGYGFSFQYPSDWLISEGDSNYLMKKLTIKLNWKNGLSGKDSYNASVLILESPDQTGRDIVMNQFNETSGSLEDIEEIVINGRPAVRFFMSGHYVGGFTGSAHILFKNKSIAIEISTGARSDSSGQAFTDFKKVITNDKILNQIALSFKFIE